MNTIEELKTSWKALKEENPKMRIRNAAKELNVSEVELLVTNCGEQVTRLEPNFKDMLPEIQKLGKVTAITRNDDVVHERKGVYLNPSFHGPQMALFVGADIDLRVFLSCWASAYAVVDGTGDKVRKSIQFFAKDGQAVHKVYLNDESNAKAYDKFVEKYKSENQEASQSIEASRPKPTERPDAEIDTAGFQKEWTDLEDTHDFYMMLRNYGVTRTQALRLAPEGLTKKVDNNIARYVLDQAAARNIPIMVFVGNQGMLQIHTGEVNKLMEYGEWYNVLDPDFNLHLRENAIAQTWVVKKPSNDGTIHSIEVFDKDGEMIVQFFGKRKPGIPELKEWRALVEEIEQKG